MEVAKLDGIKSTNSLYNYVNHHDSLGENKTQTDNLLIDSSSYYLD